MSTDTPAAAPTAEREAFEQWARRKFGPYMYLLTRSSSSAWDAWLARAALSAPVAAQPAASGVDALWVDEAMKLAKLSESASLRDFNYQGDDQKRIAENWAAYEAARAALRTHLSTALTGAAKE